MTRSLPTFPPPAVLRAAEDILMDTDFGKRGGAMDIHASHLELARQERERDRDELAALAVNLFNWGVAVREKLPSESLHRRFAKQPNDGPWISVIKEKIAIKTVGPIPGCEMVVELELCLHPSKTPLFRRHDKTPLFRRHETFNGYVLHGWDQLNTVDSILLSLFPAMLRTIHTRIADGDAWKRMEFGLKKLLKDIEDR